ncbi:MAG TPA: DUF2961 domain-containing protein [Phycisphaerae bacterium]|nr:DUF2961 domain-containing protein [Phycisphaerae bacterium]
MNRSGLFVAFALFASAVATAAEPPVVPVGLDAYRMWDRWAHQRIGVRAYMRSTYDRSGLNETADASHFLYQLADDNNVTLDVEGAGVLYFVRTNHWHGSPWRYTIDGIEHLVQESSTADPDHPVANSTFIPAELFPEPLAWTWSTTKGADLNWVPMPFERSLRLAYSRTFYGTGYYIWHQFVPGTPLSQPLVAWDGKTPPDRDVLDLINRAGTDLLENRNWRTRSSTFSLGRADSMNIHHREAPGVIRGLYLSVPREDAVAFGKYRLRITWDDRPTPSVDVPIALFFGAGTLYNRDNREYLVKGFPMVIRYTEDRVELSCFYPMPYFKHAHIEIAGPGLKGQSDELDKPIEVEVTCKWEPYAGPPNHVGYFHATYTDIPEPQFGHDMVMLDTRGIEGSRDWSGQFVGMSWIFSHNAVLTTLEGDPRFFFDDSQTPQCYGTGTEEWGGGGDYWGGRNMTLPFAGHPCGAPSATDAKCDEDKIQSAYRFLLADMMPFGKNAIIRLEHGGENQSVEHYESVVYWYGRPSPSLVKTDELKIGDPDSEKAHAYVSPEASEPVEITSRYEWGPDTLDGKEIYPPHTDRGRFTKGTSEFTLKLRPDNLGVMLRRKLDYSFPNQRAEVYVADASAAETKPDAWRKAGVWYLAGSNTCVFSAPKTETGATLHNVQTSNRRFRDDEFLIPRALTEDRSAIRVRIVFTPVERPLFPGHPMPDLAWSELRYDTYCFVMPE